jgi:hypothetical protein
MWFKIDAHFIPCCSTKWPETTGTGECSSFLTPQLAGIDAHCPAPTSWLDLKSEGRRFDSAPATASEDPTHHALSDRHAGYVSEEAGGFTNGRVVGRRGAR